MSIEIDPQTLEEQQAHTREIKLVGIKSSGVRAAGQRDIVERSVKVEKLRESFEQFLGGLKEIIAGDVPTVGEFELEEVEFSAEISAEGEFKLMGTGMGVSATSGVVFTLRRKPKSQIK